MASAFPKHLRAPFCYKSSYAFRASYSVVQRLADLLVANYPWIYFWIQPPLTLRLFIVDQSAEFSQALASTLIDLEIGLCVASVTTEQEAAVWLRDHPEGWDVLVLEPRLKAGNGLAILEQAVAACPRRTAVVLTHFATEAMRGYCLAQGAQAVFDKTTQMVAFIGHLQRLKSAHLAHRPG
jgi:ActR/RegA family two-component response regulator